jgi:hypothetical protein
VSPTILASVLDFQILVTPKLTSIWLMSARKSDGWSLIRARYGDSEFYLEIDQRVRGFSLSIDSCAILLTRVGAEGMKLQESAKSNFKLRFLWRELAVND